MNEKTYIYSLSDPINGDVRYIGKSNNIKKRYFGHTRVDQQDTHKYRWIKKLKEQNRAPIIDIIDEVPKNDWCFWEKYWISQFKAWGFKLTNSNEGGSGGETFNKEETSRKLSIVAKGRIMSEAHKLKISSAHKGKKHSLEHRKNSGLARKGAKHSEETIKIIKLVNTGRIHSKESIQKRVSKILGRKHSAKSIEKMRIAKLGKVQSDKTIEKRRLKHLGRKNNDATKRKMSIAAKIRWEKTKQTKELCLK